MPKKINPIINGLTNLPRSSPIFNQPHLMGVKRSGAKIVISSEIRAKDIEIKRNNC
jgi:hypothetical protein